MSRNWDCFCAAGSGEPAMASDESVRLRLVWHRVCANIPKFGKQDSGTQQRGRLWWFNMQSHS
jgi:hypothetical protein